MYQITALYNDEEVAYAEADASADAMQSVMEEVKGGFYAGAIDDITVKVRHPSGITITSPAYLFA